MRNIDFKDYDGVNYLYNDDTGIIIPKEIIEKTENSYFDLANKQQIEILDKYIEYINNQKIEYNKEIDKNYHIKNGIKQLTFKMTEQCNLRCRYCTYSDHYQETASYSNKHLDFETSKKAVDIYMDYYLKNKEISGNDSPFFTFYGGEPLLYFALIEKIVNYINMKYGKYMPKYLMTTNGMLFTKKNSDFLKSNNFHLSISIDGYQENHDRNRITTSGDPTYHVVIENIDKYLIDYENWNIFMCFDTLTDFDKLLNKKCLFGKGDNYFFNKIAKITPISNVNTNYYEQFTKKDFDLFKRKLNKYKKIYINQSIKNENTDPILKILFEYELILLYDRMKFVIPNSMYKFQLGLCTPGDKIFLLPNGNFSLCEKVPEFSEFIIGNVNVGLDYKLIKKLIEKTNNDFFKNCNHCPIQNNCMYCFSIMKKNDNDEFYIDTKLCKLAYKSKVTQLSDMVTLIKNDSKIFDEFFISKYKKENIYDKL